MDLTSLAAAASDMKAAQTQYAASIKVMKMALDEQAGTGASMLNALDSASNVNKAASGAITGSMIDILA